MPIVQAGKCHRVAMVVDDVDAVHDWLVDVLGAGGTVSHDSPVIPGTGGGDDLTGTTSRMVGLGGYPFVVLGGGAPGGPVARHRERFGPSLHSLAWEVTDMWGTEHRLRRGGIRIGAVNEPGRHFFMHPKDTHGLLLEWTDDHIRAVPSDGVAPVDVVEVAWVTAVVDDAQETAAFLATLAGATPVAGLPRAPSDLDLTIDVAVDEFVVRLVTPRSDESAYAAVIEGGPRLWSCGLRVTDLDGALDSLRARGMPVTHRWGNLAVTDPASTFGVPFEWTGS